MLESSTVISFSLFQNTTVKTMFYNFEDGFSI